MSGDTVEKKEYDPESVLVLGGSPHGPGDPAA